MGWRSVEVSLGAEMSNEEDLESLGIHDVTCDEVMTLFFWEFPKGWSTVEDHEEGIGIYIIDEKGYVEGPEIGNILRVAHNYQIDTGETDIEKLYNYAIGENT